MTQNFDLSVFNLSEEIKNLVVGIANISGCKIATITTRTTIKVPKKYGLSGEVTKITHKQVQVAYSYQNAVNNRLEKEGKNADFVSEPLPWGEWLIPNKLITHKGNIYLRLYDFKGAQNDKVYLVGGNGATEEEVNVIKVYEDSKSSSNRQGLTAENEVRPTSVNIDNVLTFKCGDVNYIKNANESLATSTAN